ATIETVSSAAPFYDADGTLTGIVTSTVDMTELNRRRASERDALERLRAVVDAASDGIIIADSRGIIQSCNPAAERLFGYQAAEVEGRNLSMLMPQPDARQHDGYLNAYLRTGMRKIIGIGRDVTGLRKDGSEFPMHLSVGEARQGEE